MTINTQQLTTSYAIKLEAKEDETILGYAFLVIIQNDRHVEPYGLMEDVYVQPEHRGKGIGTQLVEKVLALAKEKKCYKLIATSRHSKPDVHRLYEKLGFQNHGLEFRIDLMNSPIQTQD